MHKLVKVLIIGPSRSPNESRKGISSVVSNTMQTSLLNHFDIIQLNTTKKRYIYGFNLINISSAVIFLYKAFFILLKEKPNIIHIHTSGSWSFFMHALFVFLAKLFRKKIIFHIHDGSFDSFYETTTVKWLVKNVLNMSDALVALTPSWGHYYREYIGISNTVIIPNFIPNNIGISGNEITRKSDEETRVILFVGDIAKYRLIKGIDTVLLCIPKVIKNHNNVRFEFAGESNISQYMALCEELGIGSYVTFMGEIPYSQVQDLYINADIFLLPSRAEGLPLVIMEAMAYGLPVITSSIRGTEELIVNEVNGFVVAPGDNMLLADGILRLLENESLRYEMGAKNLEKIRQDYSEELVVGKLMDLYRNLCNKTVIPSYSITRKP